MRLIRSLAAARWLYVTVRVALALLFIYAGTSKLVSPASIAATIRDFGVIYEGSELALAIGLSVFELVCGIGLLLDVRGALGAIVGLLLVLIGVLTYGIEMGFDFDCGCLGSATTHSLPEALFFDLVLLLSCIFLYTSRRLRGTQPAGLRARLRQVRNRTGEPSL